MPTKVSVDQFDEFMWTVPPSTSQSQAAKLIQERFGLDRRHAQRKVKQWRSQHAGTSTLVRLNEDGATPVLQWRKASATKHQSDLIHEAIEEAVKEYVVPARSVKGPDRKLQDDILTVLPIGDPHLGMLSWAPETENDWDLKIAERVFSEALCHMIDRAEPSKEILILNLGDYYHSDTQMNKTLRGGNQLDVDGRWPKVLRAGMNLMRTAVDYASRRHHSVRVWNMRGNHDDHSAFALTMYLNGVFENNSRVYIETAPNPFMYYPFGKTLICSHHGHGVKATQYPGIMLSSAREHISTCQDAFWYIGHVHHQAVHEFAGNVVVEYFNTLAPGDAWAHSMGYRARRNIKVDTYHSQFGRIARYEEDVSRFIEM